MRHHFCQHPMVSGTMIGGDAMEDFFGGCGHRSGYKLYYTEKTFAKDVLHWWLGQKNFLLRHGTIRKLCFGVDLLLPLCLRRR